MSKFSTFLLPLILIYAFQLDSLDNAHNPCHLKMQSEVNFLGRLSHPNLVKLLGYCTEDNELLLVYEFMPKGSLENHLFRSKKLVSEIQ